LFRNDGDTFIDVSEEAGIYGSIIGFGLGVTVGDIDKDGWQDIYVANDFITNDLLWINQQNGSFKNEIDQYMAYQSYNGMGLDIADLNNDGLEEILVLDMLPEDNQELKLMQMSANYDRHFIAIDQLDYQAQFVRNTLQTNQGNGFFSEIGRLAGVDATHWSWAPLMIDLDNDGLRDIVISNGYPKNVIDLDYVSFIGTEGMFGSKDAKMEKQIKKIETLDPIITPNYLYKNLGNFHFQDVSNPWGFTEASVSNGAAYADLDQDGDMDLIFNNLDQELMLYENLSSKLNPHHYLQFSLKGSLSNPQAIGAKLSIWVKGEEQTHFHSSVRGFQSFVEPLAHFGLGKDSLVDSMIVVWPDGKEERKFKIPSNQRVVLNYQEASDANKKERDIQPLFFRDTTMLKEYDHKENAFVDYYQTPLLPHMLSRKGPGIAVADVDGNGLEDFYIGGSGGNTGNLFLQQADQGFIQKEFESDAAIEELGVLFFDADNDADQDLYIVSGSNEQKGGSKLYQDRLFFNDGLGNFSLDTTALPRISSSGQNVVAADYDRDGDLDLFIGSGLSPNNYPKSGQSILLKNKGNGKFEDASKLLPEQGFLGMLSSSLWTDYDEDGWLDLMVAGEWTPIGVLRNMEGKGFEYVRIEGLATSRGWWNTLYPLDWDLDGDLDYLAGNHGLNQSYEVSTQSPIHIFARDFDRNGSLDPIMAHHIQGKLQISHPRDALNKQIVAMKKRFVKYRDYAEAEWNEVLLEKEREGALELTAEKLASVMLTKGEGGEIQMNDLPMFAQFSPLKGILSHDIDGDGWEEWIIGGNDFTWEVGNGPSAALQGLVLKWGEDGEHYKIEASKAGLQIRGDARALVRIFLGDEPVFLISENQGPLHLYRLTDPPSALNTFEPEPLDSWAMQYFTDGRKKAILFTYGSGYLSQSSRKIMVPAGVLRMEVYDASGKKRELTY
ncbi:MAG: VCBS repeat-containing protein, partial [Bacteroidota bacterium]